MRCDRFREAASARLDGEPIGLSASVLEQHLATCLDCAGWIETATRLTRQIRLNPADGPDLAASITADVVLPTRRVMRRRLVLRVTLVLVGLIQLAIAVPAISGDSIGMAMSMHAAHEGAAWNLAIGVAFLASALHPRRAAGLIPLLLTFILVLGALSVHDVAADAVSIARLSTHLAALAGLLLLIGLDRAERALPPGRFSAAAGADDSRSGHGKLRGVA
ncbi:MAG: zf-HC2 domain-containing protein [Jatrophihabitantaceae bacterium]